MASSMLHLTSSVSASPFSLLCRKFINPSYGGRSLYQGSYHGASNEYPKKIEQNGILHDDDHHVPVLKVKKLSKNVVLPSRASNLSAGYDLSSSAEMKVPPRGKALVPTDLSIAIPDETYTRIAPRSGLAWKHSIDIGAGVIDADYRVQLKLSYSTTLMSILRSNPAIGFLSS